MCTFGAGAVEEIDRFAQLRAADNGIVHEQKLLVGNKLRHGDLLHLGNAVAYLLVGRHEGACPGGSVLDEGARERRFALGCITYAGGTPNQDAGIVVDVGKRSCLGFVRAMMAPLR